jgi:hypothetical protein
LANRRFQNVFSGEVLASSSQPGILELPLDTVLGRFPVALLRGLDPEV